MAALEALELDVLGKKGRLTGVLRGIGGLPAEDRPKVGAIANTVRTAIEAAIADAARGPGSAELDARLAAETIDVTMPGRPIRRGSLHPSIESMAEIARHLRPVRLRRSTRAPRSRTTSSTSSCSTSRPTTRRATCGTRSTSTSPGRLLRTHTSPGQIHVMRDGEPPIRALLPGRCFRYEAIDASHGSEFFQVEGLMVDEGTTLGDLRGLLDEFAHAMFGAGKKTRFRPGYYPFTEPSVAFDIECLVCGGAGCPACGARGWMTILGAGMVHPVVLRNGGLDPERYQGFAFGMGRADRDAAPRDQRPARCSSRTTCASWSSSDESAAGPRGCASTSTSTSRRSSSPSG